MKELLKRIFFKIINFENIDYNSLNLNNKEQFIFNVENLLSICCLN